MTLNELAARELAEGEKCRCGHAVGSHRFTRATGDDMPCNYCECYHCECPSADFYRFHREKARTLRQARSLVHLHMHA